MFSLEVEALSESEAVPPGGFTFVGKPALSLLSTKILNESQGLSQETKLVPTRVGGEFCSGEVIIQDRLSYLLALMHEGVHPL